MPTKINTPMLKDLTSPFFEIKDFESTEEWQKARPNYLGASSFAGVLHLSKYSSPQTIYASALGLRMPDNSNLEVKERGHRLEPVVADDFARKTGAIIMEDSAHDFIVVDKAHPWRGISPDRFAWPAGTDPADMTADNMFLVECKTCSNRDPKTGRVLQVTAENILEIHPEYFWQCQYQMGVCHVKRCALAFIDCNDAVLPMDYVWIDFVEPAFNQAIKKLDDLYLNHILPQIPPEEIVIPGDVLIKYPIARVSTIKATDEIYALMKRLKEVSALKSQCEKEAEDIKEKVKCFMQTNDNLCDENNYSMATFKNQAPKFDTSRFKEEEPVLYQKYITKATNRVFRPNNNYKFDE